MADECLPLTIEDREYRKFTCTDEDPAQVAIRTKGTVSPAGLSNGGLVTKVTISDTGWTALPPTPLANRNGIAIQNYETGALVRLNYDNTAAEGDSVYMTDNSERFYTITDSILIYARTATGSGSVDIICEELS